MSVRFAKFLMRLMPRRPDTTRGSIGEVFNKKDFTEGSNDYRRSVMLDMARTRYETEKKIPYSSYFGDCDLAPFFDGKKVLDFGCSNGGLSHTMLDRYDPESVTGIEVDESRLNAAEVYFDSLESQQADFVLYEGEVLPFDDETFDTVFSFDVFEHVPDLQQSVRECFRVLRPGGHMLAVFPSFYHWTEHHLCLVSGTPFVHYLFSAKTLSKAYHELLEERGEEAYWYRRDRQEFEDWEKSFSINGMTKGKFRQLCNEVGYEVARDYPLAIFETGHIRRRIPALGTLVPVFQFLGKFPILEECFNHRVAMILRKPKTSEFSNEFPDREPIYHDVITS